MMELVSIWLQRTVCRQRNGYYAKTNRIQQGDQIKVSQNTIQYLKEGEKPTHQIIGCFGTIDSSILEVMVMRLSDGEVSIIDAHREPILPDTDKGLSDLANFMDKQIEKLNKLRNKNK